MSQFRCHTCNLDIADSGAIKTHYGSELHVTNVRRKVEGQRPLTAQEFHQQSESLELGDSAVAGSDAYGAPVYSCTLCKKQFRSVQTLQAHIRSTAHLIRKEQRIIQRDSEAASMLTMTSLGSAAIGLHRRNNAKAKAFKSKEKKVEGPSVSMDDRNADASATRCMFCGYGSDTIENNLEHMMKVHAFSLPLAHHCKDVEGMLEYLARKVNGLMCLVCNEKTRSYNSLDALRDHMRESGHERVGLGSSTRTSIAAPSRTPMP
ncbi:pre-60S factor REI1 [Angomonas deanei]|nr:pre-60S factor REI1 [Angomonas deanei]|eukprot:EPY43164.1 pre-60S factor REI1 [Angomonas deanei]